MESRLYSVDQVAAILGLHVRTVRTYVREGRLPATRIGKQYRITQEDLDAFTGRRGSAQAGEPRRERRAEAWSVVEIDAVSAETASRVSTLVTSAAADRLSDGVRLRVETTYDEAHGRLKVVVLGSPGDSARILEYVDAVLSS